MAEQDSFMNSSSLADGNMNAGAFMGNQPGEGHGQNVRVITRVILLQKPTTLSDVLPFMAVFVVYGLIIQLIFSFWTKVHARSYKIFQLFLVILFPAVILYAIRDWIFVWIWLAFAALMAFCLQKAVARPMGNNVPRDIFRIFRHIFLYTNFFILLGQLGTTASFFVYLRALIPSLRVLFYSLYIAVLAREIIMNLSHIMVSRTGYFSKEGIPGVQENNNICMICTGVLRDAPGIVSLHCGHHYHCDCIRGWCLIGQNSFCPYCKKGVERSFFSQDLWEKTELPFRPLMNCVRSFISFFIVMFCIFIVRIK